MDTNTNSPSPQTWHAIVAKYNRPQLSKSIWQIVNSIVPYILLWIIMVQTLQVSFWLTLPLMVLAAGFLVRIFIIFHDCGHGSFFRSRKANVVVGKICGIMAFTHYHRWTDYHRIHHQTVGNLDRRGQGDVWTLTVEEYTSRSASRRFLYRLFRHPLFLLGFAGPLSFILVNRFTRRGMTGKQRRNIYFTNAVMLLLAAGVSWLIGWQAFLIIQLPVMYIAAVAGVYLFYLQHQYDEVVWLRTAEWDFREMALHGSSFFKLPAILRWFTGNIGYHHIHHLGSTIPNYNLKRCHDENAMFHEVRPITLFKSFHSLKLRLWDEQNKKIISFREMKSLLYQQQTSL
jgi:omega-6 fatty acid desaturase (delta-12 desaturase)